MIILLKHNAPEAEVNQLIDWLKEQNITPHISVGSSTTLIGCVGDVAKIDDGLVKAMPAVDTVKRIQEPYKLASRAFHNASSKIMCGSQNAGFGNGMFSVIAGPCSVESEEQVVSIAKDVKAAGATLLRGGAFKPRTSPYSFQGMGVEGLKLLLTAKKETGLPIVSEIMGTSDLEYFNEVDVLQVGARNMQNYELLKELGAHTKKPILLKRSFSGTLQELLMSAEYIMAGGNPNVILCERGIRTFETATRNTIDLTVVPVLHKLSHLPIVVDPSHATGASSLVSPLSLAATVIGADGLIVEVHNDPPHAKCDGAQSQTPAQFTAMMKQIKALRNFAANEMEVTK